MTRFPPHPTSPPPPPPGSIGASTRAGHEVSGISVKGMFWFIVGFVIAGLLIHLLLWGVLGALLRTEAPDPPAPPLMPPVATPPAPHLQPSPPNPNLPWQDLRALRKVEDERLASYGRIDANHAHIPIERAMALVLERHLLTATQPAASQPTYLTTRPTSEGNR